MDLAKFIPWLPALAAVLCGLCATRKSLRGLAAPICILGIAGAFALSVWVSRGVHPAAHDGHGPDAGTAEAAADTAHAGGAGGAVVPAFDWIKIGDESDPGGVIFNAPFAYFIDPLTILMLFVVTGIGALVAIYAAGYMKGDRGYARFFAFVSLFIFAMTTLVMADNLVLLYLGWEGVGLCSYLLIGYYYDKPSAVAAAKKAFIVNRIGDLGFALGIWLTYTTFGTVSLSGEGGVIAQAQGMLASGAKPQAALWVPFLLMLGAFGKSAQVPLYVWLPDAMEGPTPVSALIHAATMVTAGVYLIARLIPVFQLSPAALPTVAFIGALTAIFAATIALNQYDIKRVYAYSTISQLGYMFLGVGALSTFGGVFHLFTHAFFKALLFLTAGSVMHALAGQLDLRKMSGLRTKMPVTCWLMFVGCLALAGFPGLAGFFSKDTILAAAMERGLSGDADSTLYMALAIAGLLTAFLTAYYTFRLWFRVFLGPAQWEMGDAHHGADEAHDAESDSIHEPGHVPAGAGAPAHAHASGSEPHEMPWLMNAPLVVLAIGAAFAGLREEGFLRFVGLEGHWVRSHVLGSTAAPAGVHAGEHHGPSLFGTGDLHAEMMVVSSLIALAGIATAAYFHWFNRPAADRAARTHAALVRLFENKYYIDEINDALIVRPLRMLGEVFFIVDRLVIDGLVALVGFLPRAAGLTIRPSQRGVLQGYGVGMVFGAAAVLLMVFVILRYGGRVG